MKTTESKGYNQDEGDYHHLIFGHDCLLDTNHVSSEDVDEILLQFSRSHKSYGE